MVDESKTEPLPDPVTQPVPTAAPAAAPVAATAVSAAPVVSAATPAPAPAGPSRRTRLLGLGAEIAGVVGIVLFVVLAVGVILGRGWATSTVDDLAGGADAKLAQVAPLLDSASAKVSEINGRVGALEDAANSLAAKADAGTGLLGGLRDQLANLQNRYLEFRAKYTDVRQTAVTALDRLQVMERLIPGFTVPQGAVDALTALDARVQELDAKIMDVSNALTDGPVQTVATAVAQKAATVQDGLTKLTDVINGAQARLAEVRTKLASTADTVRLSINIGSIGLFLLSLYFALLHWLLFRTGRQMRQVTTGS